jgi:hypothetical protein
VSPGCQLHAAVWNDDGLAGLPSAASRPIAPMIQSS